MIRWSKRGVLQMRSVWRILGQDDRDEGLWLMKMGISEVAAPKNTINNYSLSVLGVSAVKNRVVNPASGGENRIAFASFWSYTRGQGVSH